MNGLVLTFHLAGINNQNFLMRDDQTGTYWQQISGRAVSGPLEGKVLPFVRSDELTFALWKAEQPRGTVLRDVPAYTSGYASKDWDVKMRKAPTVISHAQPGLAARDVMLGVQAFGAARAFRYESVQQAKLVEDHVGSERVLLVVGPDARSVRAFHVAGQAEFYRTFDDQAVKLSNVRAESPLMVDETGSKWDFQGCAVEGPRKGTCLEPLEAIKDYWFDWREYHPDTTVYGRKVR